MGRRNKKSRWIFMKNQKSRFLNFLAQKSFPDDINNVRRWFWAPSVYRLKSPARFSLCGALLAASLLSPPSCFSVTPPPLSCFPAGASDAKDGSLMKLPHARSCADLNLQAIVRLQHQRHGDESLRTPSMALALAAETHHKLWTCYCYLRCCHCFFFSLAVAVSLI